MTETTPPPGWYTDHTDQRFVRWWDGQQWTPHVQPAQGQQGRSDAEGFELGIDRGHDADRVRQQAQKTTGGATVEGGGGTLFTEPILVVNQKAKLMEMASEYGVFDQNGQPLGSVAQIGQSGLQKVLRVVSTWDQFMTHKFEIRDNHHTPLLYVTRPAKFIKSRLIIHYPNGAQLGEIVQENAFGKIRFGFHVGGQPVGGIRAENWRAWNFSIHDAQDNEVAKITKTFAGLARAAFTTADNYVVQLHAPLQDPLCSLVVVSGLTVDTALKQSA